MSDKFFFKGRKTPKPKHESYGYNTKREVKIGTAESPLALTVTTAEREAEVRQIVADNKLVAVITVDPEQSEDIVQLEGLLNKPQTTRFEKTPNRNDPCMCGSGKKYKKCCG
ncbi:PBPRA1643 family SWIM/SEC-C metal-binding motif protein [Shewanella fidelis]|uniref:SEC-C metal-binding domain-containing protein n=1 Tax=Shewanella fidelis TaxID=173509 RepID=A0AAW8NKL8_9GAMM|nr:PBPRA1643 family SWIM/SEC-C metal-binding motif protein [Shewanella fidelis]MDR8523808.1 SEC-C metal-binding domain-containing protein [Shewanella fidelis]MDW4810356.1 SEC-C metal-binding domain-containing protein [Shewanella fidelis]MDW4814501.1 SEC-C metal-binding domain-containing protein [Shewanella fidelis]MDW4818591.1 SEC-C metal-binding domain-containing protein [Shewanella fidelis]MDW4823756.1 SEC-C metal-binding domain-containing protein [Shewanella fidelis]